MKKIIAVFLFLLGACVSARPPVIPVSATFDEKIDSVSKQFLGRKYALDPLGEGQGFDSDPLIRNDKFDCVTYVETVWAYAKDGDVLQNKIKISYFDSVPSYIGRKHFWELDHNGDLTDITAKLGVATTTRPETVDRAAWLLAKNSDLKSDFKPVKFKLRYVAKANIKNIKTDSLPQILLIGVVGYKPGPGRGFTGNAYVSHVGFVIKKPDGKVVVRHASSAKGEVVEQSWQEFTDAQMCLKTRVGIKIWEIKERGTKGMKK